MFIKKVMKKILAPISEKYMKDIELASNMDEQQLVSAIINEINNDGYDVCNDMQGTIVIACPGCSHNVQEGIHCGCSFCDWNNSYVANPAYMKVLRNKNKALYIEIVRKILLLTRGERKIHFFEEFAIHDCFDDQQITVEEINDLFIEQGVFYSKPIIGLVQARADSINLEKIEIWKKTVTKGLTIGIGVECGDEWIRNHWLNKDISNKQIENAIMLAHQNNCKISANLLSRIPGLNVIQSTELLIESIEWLWKNKIDSVMISPLVIKKYTIQNYLDNKENAKYDFIYLLESVCQLRDELKRIIMFSSLNIRDSAVFGKLENQNILSIEKILCDAGGMKNFDIINEKIKDICCSFEYKEYIENKKKDNLTINESICNAAQTLSKKLFNGNEHLEEFRKELNNECK